MVDHEVNGIADLREMVDGGVEESCILVGGRRAG